jgi:hypothetical protein
MGYGLLTVKVVSLILSFVDNIGYDLRTVMVVSLILRFNWFGVLENGD